MTSVAKALYAFYSGFSIPAYTEESVPADASFPYISYTIVEPHWTEYAVHQVRVWYRDTGFSAVLAKADEIVRAVGEGLTLEADGGYVTLNPGTPLMQMQPTDEPLIKAAYINLQLGAFIRRR